MIDDKLKQIEYYYSLFDKDYKALNRHKAQNAKLNSKHFLDIKPFIDTSFNSLSTKEIKDFFYWSNKIEINHLPYTSINLPNLDLNGNLYTINYTKLRDNQKWKDEIPEQLAPIFFNLFIFISDRIYTHKKFAIQIGIDYESLQLYEILFPIDDDGRDILNQLILTRIYMNLGEYLDNIINILKLKSFKLE